MFFGSLAALLFAGVGLILWGGKTLIKAAKQLR